MLLEMMDELYVTGGSTYHEHCIVIGYPVPADGLGVGIIDQQEGWFRKAGRAGRAGLAELRPHAAS
jgi:hypothetical protein